MDGQRRFSQSLKRAIRRANTRLTVFEPGLAVRRAARGAAVAFLLGSVGFGLLRGGHLTAWINQPPGFAYTASDIEIAGLTNHQPTDVLAAIGMEPGASMVWFDTDIARRRIEALSWVERATVERRLPNQLVIALAERQPYAVWQTGEAYTVIDRNGVAMNGVLIDRLKGLPMLTGDGANLVAPEIVEALHAAPDLMLRMQAAARVGTRRWNIYLDDGIKILLPENEPAKALQYLVQVNGATGLLSKGIQAVDLRNPRQLVVTALPEPKQTDPQKQATNVTQ